MLTDKGGAPFHPGSVRLVDLNRDGKELTMRKTRAFTLIELLVVIAIIALLMAILVPALSRARMQGQRAACMALLRSFGQANAAYAASNDGRGVPFSQGAPPTHVSPGGSYWDERWPENREFRKCLSNTKSILDSGWEDPFIFPKELLCPAHRVPMNEAYLEQVKNDVGWKLRMSIALNTELWIGNAVSDPFSWYPSDKVYRGHFLSMVKKPGECMMFIDGNFYQTRYEKANYEKYWDVYGDVLTGTITGTGNVGQVSYRHKDTACIAYFDGHAGYLKKTEVYFKDNRPPENLLSRRKPMWLWDAYYPTIRATLP